MAFEIIKKSDTAFKLNRPLYLDESKTKVVEEDDPKARYVLGGTGSTVDDAEVERLGLNESHQLVEEDEEGAEESTEEGVAPKAKATKKPAAKKK